ncbi:MAG: LeoA/HP0731 family dynamin-like GTPase, partial [Dolichospermum sp.]
TCFIDADSYLKSQDPKYIKYQQSLQTKSNFNDFLDSLEKLIQKNELSAKLVTPLHDAVKTLEKSLNFLSTNDEKTRNLLEILRRAKIIIQASQTRARNAYRSELAKLKHEVIMLGEKIASMIDGHHTQEEIEVEIEKVTKEITTLSEKTIGKIQAALEEELKTLQEKLEELQNSPLGKNIDREIAIDLVDGKRINDPNISDEFGQSILEKQGGKILRGIGKLSSKVSRNLVYKTGKFLGFKFKPFGAIKTAKFIRSLGPVIAGVGVLFDVAMTVKEDDDDKKNQRQLRNARTQVREEFRKEAEEMVKEYELNIEEDISFYNEELNDIENNQQELRDSEQSKHEILTQIENKRQEIKQEIKQLIK